MGIASWLAARFRRRPDPQAAAFEEQFWRDLLSATATSSGVFVNWRVAMENPTALRCGLLLADGVSTVPCKLMRKDPTTGTRTEVTDHPLSDLLSFAPCDWMTSQQFRETMMLRAVFDRQGGFAYINKVGRGRISEIFPFEQDEVSVEKRSDTYDRSPLYRVNGEEVPNDRILHVRGPSWDGRAGLNMVQLAREVIGLAEAAQDAHAKRFGNGIQTTGVYSVDGALDETAYKRLMAWLKQYGPTGKRSGEPLLLDRNAKWTPMGLTGVDAEHLATRQHQDLLTCRQMGVLPIMAGIADKTATYASSEQMFLAHSVHTIRPWHVRVKEILEMRLLTAQERADGYYIHFVDTALLRGAAKDRAEFYAKLFSVGAITPNQIMAFEDMDGFEGGDEHFVPANVARLLPDGSMQGPSGTGKAAADRAQPPAGRLNAGRVLSAANEGLIRDASDNLTTVLSKLDGQQED